MPDHTGPDRHRQGPENQLFPPFIRRNDLRLLKARRILSKYSFNVTKRHTTGVSIRENDRIIYIYL